jgi:hypothetical protein
MIAIEFGRKNITGVVRRKRFDLEREAVKPLRAIGFTNKFKPNTLKGN